MRRGKRLEDFVQLGFDGSEKAVGIRHRLLVGSELGQRIRRCVAGEDDDAVLEVNGAAFPVFHVALVEDLVEKFE